MNNKIKIGIWDGDLVNDERAGTFYVMFKEISKNPLPPTWVNLYGPPRALENDYADLMSLYGEKGSHYVGRVLYEISSHNEELPKTEVIDL